MVLIDRTFPTPQENILFDEFLLLRAEKAQGSEVLRFWESPQHFIVLGRTGNLQEDVDIQRAQEEKIPILRRFSGGGTVIQGKGCMNFTLILSKDRDPALKDITKSYLYILGKVSEALSLLGIPTRFKPTSDLVIGNDEKKFSGNAQHRGRQYVLHHGTILYNFDLQMIAGFLKMPRAVPEYRGGRSHLDFVTNISVSYPGIKNSFKKIFGIHKKEIRLTKEEMVQWDEFLKRKTSDVVIAL